jgi:DNA phosphorothioation-dependent restriction protein DptG
MMEKSIIVGKLKYIDRVCSQEIEEIHMILMADHEDWLQTEEEYLNSIDNKELSEIRGVHNMIIDEIHEIELLAMDNVRFATNLKHTCMAVFQQTRIKNMNVMRGFYELYGYLNRDKNIHKYVRTYLTNVRT